MDQNPALVMLLALLCAAGVASASLSPRIREQEITLEPKLLQDVPIVDPPKRVAGYFKLARTYSAEMFYFFFQARQAPATAPLVLWMTGGPGCSSELAVLYENGPYTLVNKTLVETQYGWDALHNMIFVDQPIGTGFSYSEDDRDTVHDETGVADDMLDFLREFFKAHPELADAPLFITGESYAGHYVPAVAHRLWAANKAGEGPAINLQGLAVGNGLTNPTIQFGAYGDYALANGLIGSTTRAVMSFTYPLCNFANYLCDKLDWTIVCVLGLQYCMSTQFAPILDANPDINVYDITRKCDGRLCYDFSDADDFLNRPSTRKALGVGDREWVSCAPDVYQNMAGDWLHAFDTVLPEMLADGIRVMIYAGDLDLICNWVGNRRWVDSLQWERSEDWSKAADRVWKVKGQPAGEVREVGPLSFVRVYKAGHMVPMDQGLNSLVMISSWVRDRALAHTAAAAVPPDATRTQLLSALSAQTPTLRSAPAHAHSGMSGVGHAHAEPAAHSSSSAARFVSHVTSRLAGAAAKAHGAAMQQLPAHLRRVLRMA